MSKVWLFKDFIKCSNQVKKKDKYVLKRVSFGSKDCTNELELKCAYFLLFAFSMNHFGQNFPFVHWLLFSRNLDGIKEKDPKHQKS